MYVGIGNDCNFFKMINIEKIKLKLSKKKKKKKLKKLKQHETCKISSMDDDLLNFTPQCFLNSAVQIVPNASERTDACVNQNVNIRYS